MSNEQQRIERNRAQKRARYAANREKHRAQKRAWRAANREKHRAQKRAWYAANPEKHRATSRAWSAAHPEVKVRHDLSRGTKIPSSLWPDGLVQVIIINRKIKSYVTTKRPRRIEAADA